MAKKDKKNGEPKTDKKITRVLQFGNQKGGVAKTTSAWNVGKELARRGYRVLLVDIDAQASLTITWFRFNSYEDLHDHKVTLFNVLLDQKEYVNARKGIVGRQQYTINSIMDLVSDDMPNLYAVASNISLAKMDTEQAIGREHLLASVLAPEHGKWDFIILDSPPNLGLMFVNGLVAANYLLIPMQAEYYSMVGLDMLFMTVDQTTQPRMSSVDVLGIIITQFEEQTKINRKALQAITNGEGQNTHIFKSTIRKSTIVKEAIARRKAVFEIDPEHKVAKEYSSLVDEIIEQIERREGVAVVPQFKESR